MFDFFGTFLDGPLAGSTFGGVINDGSGGDSVGPFLALGGMAFVLAIVLSIIIAPFVAWPSLIASNLNEGRGIWGAIILIAIQFIFIILRIRSNVRHWKRSFLSDLLLNMLFLFLLFFLSVVILFVPLITLLGGSEMGAYAAAHYGEFFGDGGLQSVCQPVRHRLLHLGVVHDPCSTDHGMLDTVHQESGPCGRHKGMIDQIDPDSGPRIIYRVKRAVSPFLMCPYPMHHVLWIMMTYS